MKRANKGIIKTPYKDVEVDIKYAFIHLRKIPTTQIEIISKVDFATFKILFSWLLVSFNRHIFRARAVFAKRIL